MAASGNTSAGSRLQAAAPARLDQRHLPQYHDDRAPFSPVVRLAADVRAAFR
jgi:hypothetical protein